MKLIDKYHRWVEWSDEDQAYKELGEVVEEVLDHVQQSGRTLPLVRKRPMMEVVLTRQSSLVGVF